MFRLHTGYDSPRCQTKKLLAENNPKKVIPFGKHFVSWKHLHILVQNFAKDKHQLTISVLNPDDKMKFDYVLGICDTRVTELLKERFEGSQATVLYLDLLRNILVSGPSLVETQQHVLANTENISYEP